MSKPPFITVAEAQRRIHDPKITHGKGKVFAAAKLMEVCEHDLQVTFADMLRCLDYGGTIAEMGARCLYVRTGRDGLGNGNAGSNGLPFIMDRSDWESYLREHYPGASLGAATGGSIKRMGVTPFATFASAFPDDSVEERGHLVVPGGQNIMRAINDRLAARGYRVSNLDQHSTYGWSLDLRGPEGNFWLWVQYPGPWLLSVHDSRMIWSRVSGGKNQFAAFIDECRMCLASIPELSRVSWLTKEEFKIEMRSKCPPPIRRHAAHTLNHRP